MRIRSTKPEFWRSKTIAALPWDVRLVLKGLESYVDDNGVGKDDIALIAADVFPRDLSASPRETLARLSEAISTLSRTGLIARYVTDGDELIYIDRWKDIQRIDKPARGRFPRPDGTREYSEEVNRESYAKPRETVASPPEVLAPGTGEQGNRGVTTSSDKSDKIDDRFDEFWRHYPRKEAKVDARKAWTQVTKKTDAQTIIDGLTAYGFGPDKKFHPLPASWLRGQRWEDERATVHQLPTTPRRPASGQSFADGTLMPWDR